MPIKIIFLAIYYKIAVFGANDLVFKHVDESELKPVNGALTVTDSIRQIDRQYYWLDNIHWKHAEATALLWYVSEEKLEPRLGLRNQDAFEVYEQPLAPARDIMAYRQEERIPEIVTEAGILEGRSPWYPGIKTDHI